MLENRDSAVPVIPVTPVARPSAGLAGLPLLALCCLLCTLLVIASTIVLALIPVYLQSSTSARTGTSANRFTNFDLGQPIADGALPAAAANQIAAPIQQGLNVPAGAVGIQGAQAATVAGGKRRRRALQQRDRRVAIAGFGIQLIYVIFFFILAICGAVCTTIAAAVTFILPAFVLTINGIAFSVLRQSISTSASNPGVSPNSGVTASTTSTASTASTTTRTTVTVATTTTGMVNG